MLEIRKEVLQEITRSFLSGERERGFLLACASRLDRLEYCCEIPAVQAGLYFYEPDAKMADYEIRRWAEQGICFCGFLHSHIVSQNKLSQNDIDFARELFYAYSLPVMWFGLGIVTEGNVSFSFYAITGSDKRDINISPTVFSVIE